MTCAIDLGCGTPYIPSRVFETIKIAYDPYNMSTQTPNGCSSAPSPSSKDADQIPDGEIFIMLVLALILVYLFHIV